MDFPEISSVFMKSISSPQTQTQTKESEGCGSSQQSSHRRIVPWESRWPTVREEAVRFESVPPYHDFFTDIFLRNQLCILGPSCTESWASRKLWVTDQGTPNFEFLRNHFGNVKAPITNCNATDCDGQEKFEMTVSDFIDYWETYRSDSHPTDVECLYLKDWHFTRDFPSFCAYSPPPALCSDWLNEFWDVRRDLEDGADDYRFVYLGPKHTWTPFHSDVLRSYSWSANICGRKKWIFFPPGEEHKLRDRYGQMIYDLRDPDLGDPGKYPHAAGVMATKAIEVIQNPGEIVFVPSGWHHQVFNLEDTISINHNWVNGCSAHMTWAFLKSKAARVKQEIADCAGMEGFHSQCQKILKADSGMDYMEFYNFLATIACHRVCALDAFLQYASSFLAEQDSNPSACGEQDTGTSTRLEQLERLVSNTSLCLWNAALAVQRQQRQQQQQQPHDSSSAAEVPASVHHTTTEPNLLHHHQGCSSPDNNMNSIVFAIPQSDHTQLPSVRTHHNATGESNPLRQQQCHSPNNNNNNNTNTTTNNNNTTNNNKQTNKTTATITTTTTPTNNTVNDILQSDWTELSATGTTSSSSVMTEDRPPTPSAPASVMKPEHPDVLTTRVKNCDDSTDEEIVTSRPNNRDDSRDEEIVTSRPNNCDDSRDEEIVTSRPNNCDDSRDEEIVTSRPNNCDDSRDEEIVTSRPNNCDDSRDEEIVTSRPNNRDDSRDEEIVTSRPNNCDDSRDEEIVTSRPNNRDDSRDEEIVTSRPNNRDDSRDEEIVTSRPNNCDDSRDEEIVTSRPNNRDDSKGDEIVTSRPNNYDDSPDEEIVTSRPNNCDDSKGDEIVTSAVTHSPSESEPVSSSSILLEKEEREEKLKGKINKKSKAKSVSFSAEIKSYEFTASKSGNGFPSARQDCDPAMKLDIVCSDEDTISGLEQKGSSASSTASVEGMGSDSSRSIIGRESCPHWAHCGCRLAAFDLQRVLAILQDLTQQPEWGKVLEESKSQSQADTAVCGTRELGDDGKNGRRVLCEDYDALKTRIENCLKNVEEYLY